MGFCLASMAIGRLLLRKIVNSPELMLLIAGIASVAGFQLTRTRTVVDRD